jgi:hypothetical protein
MSGGVENSAFDSDDEDDVHGSHDTLSSHEEDEDGNDSDLSDHETKANGSKKSKRQQKTNGFDDLMDHQSSNAFTYSVEVAMLEIYNETVSARSV